MSILWQHVYHECSCLSVRLMLNSVLKGSGCTKCNHFTFKIYKMFTPRAGNTSFHQPLLPDESALSVVQNRFFLSPLFSALYQLFFTPPCQSLVRLAYFSNVNTGTVNLHPLGKYHYIVIVSNLQGP